MKFFIKESVKLLVVALIVVATFFIATGYFITSYNKEVQKRFQVAIDNVKSKALLGMILSEKTYIIESKIQQLISTDKSKYNSINTTEKEIINSIEELKRVLQILEDGGVYIEKLPINLVDEEHVVKKISYFRRDSGYVPQVVLLKSNFLELINEIKNISQARQTIQFSHDIIDVKESKKTFEFFIQSTPSFFNHLHEIINSIFYETKFEIEKLEFKKEKKGIFLDRLSKTVFLFSFIFALTLTYFIIKRIAFLLRTHETNIRKIKETNKKLLLSQAEIMQQLYKIKNNEKLLKEQNKRLENFAYITSHDLQEPLNTIIGFSDILKNKYQSDLEEFALKSLNKIQSASVRMKTLINELLVYSRLGENDELEQGDVNSLLEEIKEDLSDTIDKNNVKIIYDKLPVITVYKREMKALMQNLISNAIKYKKTNVNPVIKITSEEKPSFFMFTVSDNGIGMNMKHHKKIFDIFKRLHTRDEYSGTGIGLATCQRVVELHQGEIWVESEERKGSTFYFTISKKLKK